MIFRTGSVLIVGKCDENVLMLIYEFLKNIFNVEYTKICQKNSSFDLSEVNKNKIDKEKRKKIRKKNILVTVTG
jgi:hypothetical protein